MSTQTAIRVRLPNRPGELIRLATKFAQAGINLEAGAGIATGPEGVLEVLVSDTSQAERILREQGVSFEETRVTLAWVPEKVGGLAEVIKPLSDAGININALYLVRAEGNQNLVALGTDNPEKADQLLSARGGSR
jgi:hypothetical protein